jgi:hypothetical protein
MPVDALRLSARGKFSSAVLRGTCLLAALTAVTDCARVHPDATPVVAPTRVIALDSLRPPVRVRAAAIHDYDAALGSALSVIETELKFPVLTTSIFIFPDRDSLRQDLVEAGYDAGYAARVSSALDGISSPDRVRINRAAMERMSWPDRVGVLAHELTHIAENQLSDGKRTGSEQWLREGFAEWVSFEVLEVLGSRSLSSRRDAAIASLNAASRGGGLPRLSDLVSSVDWITAVERARPVSPIYNAAFLAADELVARRGVPGVLKYFALSASSSNRMANFAEAFGEARGEFHGRTERQFARYMEEGDPLPGPLQPRPRARTAGTTTR